MENRTVTVDLDDRSYDITIGMGLLEKAADFIPMSLSNKSVFIIYDESVLNYAETVANNINSTDAKSVYLVGVPSGESSKSFASVQSITEQILEKGISRNSLVIAVGGGVIGDLAGFCASILLRGVPFVQIPTTLLSQVDSSVGGKTGINTAQGKNLIGAFYQPIAVIIDTETLETLPERQVLAGYAEIVKCGLLYDAKFYAWLEEHGRAVTQLKHAHLVRAIETSVIIKAEVVKADETEQTGMRALLNLGHTFGHALEAAAGYDGRLLHGEAVSIGTIMALDLSARLKFITEDDFDRVIDHFEEIGLPTDLSVISPPLTASMDKYIETMRRDKKAVDGQMQFIVCKKIGKAAVHSDVSEKLIREIFRDTFGPDYQAILASQTVTEFKMKGVRGLWKSAFSSQS
jgi:3-dehydroquinate synthase